MINTKAERRAFAIAGFVADLGTMSLTDLVRLTITLGEYEAETEDHEQARNYRLERACVEAVGRLRFGAEYEDAERAPFTNF